MPDPGLRAELALTALTAEQIGHWLCDQGQSPGRLAEALARAVIRLASGEPGRGGPS